MKRLIKNVRGCASAAKKVLAVVCCLSLSACASSAVLRRPKSKNLDSVKPGISRGFVIAELSQPVSSSDASGEKCDSFAFDKGVHMGWKASRAIFHLGADLFTLFLWELVAWPAERAVAGNNTKVEVCYDQAEKVKTVTYAK